MPLRHAGAASAAARDYSNRNPEFNNFSLTCGVFGGTLRRDSGRAGPGNV
jgi:hypothetical protein